MKESRKRDKRKKKYKECKMVKQNPIFGIKADKSARELLNKVRGWVLMVNKQLFKNKKRKIKLSRF